jgi:hypothetical protein
VVSGSPSVWIVEGGEVVNRKRLRQAIEITRGTRRSTLASTEHHDHCAYPHGPPPHGGDDTPVLD